MAMNTFHAHSCRWGIYTAIYLGAVVWFTIFTLLRSSLFAIRTLSCGSQVHLELLETVFRAPMAFFDRTATGEILTWFGQDVASKLNIGFQFLQFQFWTWVCTLHFNWV